VAAGLSLCRASGWNQTEGDWRALLEAPSVFRAVVWDGQVVGTAGAVVYGRELAWVSMVLVDPAYRGRGLAKQLVSQVLERLSGIARVGLDATPLGRPVYARLGFAEDCGLWRLEVPAERHALGTAEDPRVRLLRPDDLGSVLRWDREVFGADRGRVLRFALAQAPDGALVAEAAGRLEGYCFSRPGHHAMQIGPLGARTEEAARALAHASLARGAGGPIFMDATGPPWWAPLGFREQRPFTRMSLGRPQPVPEGLFAVFGPEFG